MKKTLKVIVIMVLLFAAYHLGVYIESPKNIIHKELEGKYKVLDGYRQWDYTYGTKGSDKLFKTEVKLNNLGASEFWAIACENGLKAKKIFYSGFGNPRYGIGSIGTFDGYFSSVYILECGDHYYIQERDNERGEKFYGPFNFTP